MRITFRSDFSDISFIQNSIRKVMARDFVRIFDHIHFHYTTRDDVSINDGEAVISIKYDPRIQDQAIMDAKVATLLFRTLMMERMDLSFLDGLDFSFVEDSIQYSRLENEKEKVIRFVKELIWDWFAFRMAVAEFPNEMFNFSYFYLHLDGDVYFLLKKPLYVYCFKGKDDYSFSYLKEMFPVEDFWFIYNLFPKARTREDFLYIAREIIRELGKRL